MLVEHPHDFARVHRGAAAHRYYAVGAEVRHRLRAFARAGERRVGSDVEECRVLYTHFVEAVGYHLGVAVVVKEGVRDDEYLLFAEDFLELAQRDGQAALLYICLLRRAEPEHILSPFGDGFDVEQVLHADVLRDGVPAPRAAAERERRCRIEVVDVAYAALRRGRVDEDAARLHVRLEVVELFTLRHCVEVDRRSVAEAAVRDEALRLRYGVPEVRGAVHCKHGRELFMRELLAYVYALYFADEYLRALRDFDAGHSRYLVRLLSDYRGVQRAVDDYRLAHALRLLPVEEPASARGELRADFVINRIYRYDGLLGGAYHAVVESF